jgi:hypothetical protein
VTGYLEKLMGALTNPEIPFVVINNKDYFEKVLLNMTKDHYEPCTRPEDLLLGFVGSYSDVKRVPNPYCYIYIRREVTRNLILCGKEGQNPLEPIFMKEPLEGE